MGGGISSEVSLEDKVQLLKQTPFFTLFENAEAIRECAKHFKVKHVKEGQQVADGVFIVVAEGELALSTLVPRNMLKRNTDAPPAKPERGVGGKGIVSELLAVKKQGDFFSKAGRELAASTSNFLRQKNKAKYHGDLQKVVSAFDFTTVRALRDSKILVLDGKAKKEYLEKNAAKAMLLEKILNTDIRQLLKPIPFLKGIHKNRLSSLSELFIYETYEPEEVVLEEGSMDDSFYLVLQGKLDVTATILQEKSITHSFSITQICEEENHRKEPENNKSVPNNGAKGDSKESEGDEDKETEPTDDVEAAKVGDTETESGTGEARLVQALDPGSPTSNDGQTKRITMGGQGVEQQPAKKRAVPVLKPQPSMRLLRKSSTLVNEDINTIHLATIEGGSYFGEMGMLIKMPRTATIRTINKCLLAKMRGSDFANFLKLSPEIQQALDQDARERMVRKLYAFRLPFFAGIEKTKLLDLANHCEIQQHPKGTVLMEEGGICGTFFIVINGLVNVIKNGNLLVRLAQGAYFGEISMITGNPHLATVAAHSDVVLLAVTKDAFDQFFKGSEELLAEFEMRILGEKHITLKHVLRHALGRELFRQHLINEFSVEHLDFYEAVNDYHKGNVKFSKICSNFIGPNSKTPINVSAVMSQRVLDGPELPSSFDECYEEVFNLMKRDNFERFKKTILFKELVDAIFIYPSEMDIDHANVRKADMSFGKIYENRVSLL